MAFYLDPQSRISFGWDEGEDTWGVPTNRSLQQLAYVGLHPSVKNTTRTSPPTSPAESDKYIVAANPTGAWSTYNEGDLAVWGRSVSSPATLSWIRFQPRNGTIVNNEDTDQLIRYDGTDWSVAGGVQSDWSVTDVNNPAHILNKPDFAEALTGEQEFDYNGTANLEHTETLATVTLNDAQRRAMFLGDNFRAAVRVRYTGAASNTLSQVILTLGYAGLGQSQADTASSALTLTSNLSTVNRRLLRTTGIDVHTVAGSDRSLSERYPNTATVSLVTTATSSDSFTCQGTVIWGIQF